MYPLVDPKAGDKQLRKAIQIVGDKLAEFSRTPSAIGTLRISQLAEALSLLNCAHSLLRLAVSDPIDQRAVMVNAFEHLKVDADMRRAVANRRKREKMSRRK